MSDESETRARSAAIHGANAAREHAPQSLARPRRSCSPLHQCQPASAAVVAANGSRTSDICPRGQTGKRFLPKRSFGSIHSTCLSALFTDRAMEAWYHPSIA